MGGTAPNTPVRLQESVLPEGSIGTESWYHHPTSMIVYGSPSCLTWLKSASLSSLRSCKPPAGTMGPKAQGMKRFTPAAFAAVAKGIWERTSQATMVEMRISIPERAVTRSSRGAESSMGRWVTPRAERSLFACFCSEEGRVRAMISWDGCVS